MTDDDSKSWIDQRVIAGNRGEEELFVELAGLLQELRRSITVQVSEKNPRGATFAQILLLGHIAAGIDSVSDLAKHLRISPAAVSKMVEGMVRGGLLSRDRSGLDRRIVRLVPTAQGREVLSTNRKVVWEVFRHAFGVLSSSEVAELIRLLKKILAAAEN